MRKGLREEDARASAGRLGGKIVRVRPVSSSPHADETRLGQPQFAEQRVVAGAIDKNRIAGLDELADDHVERIVRTLSQKNLRRLRADRALRQQSGDALP